MSQDMNNGTTPPAALDTAEKKGKGRPKFFSTLGKKEETSEVATADPAAARLSRATRGKAATPAKTGERKQSQQESKAPAKATTAARPAAQPARRGGFKPRHIIGILLYLIVADVAGLYEKQLLVNSHIEKLLFNLGPIPVYLSTVMFLLTLVLLLIVLARFDLVPRSLTPSRTGPASKGQSKASPRDNNDNGQPGMKQGVKGADDALYQEYRQNQRYWQRRDRKK